MLLRRFLTRSQVFSRILLSNSAKVTTLLHVVKKAATSSRYTFLFASALGINASLYTRYLANTLIQCESTTTDNMAEIEKANQLYNEHKFKELYEYLVEFKDSEDPELLWRVVRAYRDRANMAEVSADEKKKIIFEAMEISKRALEFGENKNYAVHKWYGIMLSQTGDYLGTKVKLDNSPAMKVHFEKAIELNPQDATSHYLIGMWCFSFADLAWYQRKLAAAVFGSPPTSTYEEALGHFMKAEEMSPCFYSANQYMIGNVNQKMGNKAAAKEWFQKLLDFPVVKDEDSENVKKAQDALKSL